MFGIGQHNRDMADRLCAARLQRAGAESVLALRLSRRARLRRAGPRRRLGAACRPRRRRCRPRYRHRGAVAAGAAVFQRQGFCARLLRRRPHGLRRGGARRRRRRGVVLRHGHRQACRRIRPGELPGAIALRPEGPAHSAAGNRRGDARGGAVGPISKFFSTPRPATPSSIRSGRLTTPHPPSLPASGSTR